MKATVIALAAAMILAGSALAQCPMCRNALASQGPQAAGVFNAAIIILLVPAVYVFCGVYWLALRRRPKDE